MEKIKISELKRCPWSEINGKMRAYHDNEWGTPCRSDRVLFEYILLDSFQAGLSWDIILKKRENFRRVFSNFDPEKIAHYDRQKVDALIKDASIVRNRGKIEAAVQNAKIFLAIQKEFGSFAKYLWGFAGDRPKINARKTESEIPARTELGDIISKDLKKRGFRFFGPTTCYAFLQGAGIVNDHLASCFRHKELH
jgi:DNA-3-methyladenine glycosylase I